jgi:hypothetical protein
MRNLIGEKLKIDWRITTITIVSTLLLLVDHYRTLTSYKYWDRAILYLLIPLAITILVFREHPREYGFSLGNWKLGLAYTALGILLMAPIIYFLGKENTAMQKYYGGLFLGLPWTTFLDLIGWEFSFVVGFYSPMPANLDTMPSGCKPSHLRWRTWASLNWKPSPPSSADLPLAGWRTAQNRSLYPFLIHWFISTFIILVAAGFV